MPERVHSSSSALADVERAYRTAVHGRRTVVLNLPLDVQAAETPNPAAGSAAAGPTDRPPDRTWHDPSPTDPACRAAGVPGRTRRAGPTVRALAALADRVGALLITSAVAAGTFADEAYDLGICGGFATPLAAELVAAADVVVAWGCSLTRWTTRHGRMLGPEARWSQVDDDPAAIGAPPPSRPRRPR